jgi:hypothetical protein
MKRPGQPKRTPFRRTRELARGSGPRTSSSAPLRSSPLPAVNRARKASEFVRAYGSRKRVAWVKRRPCIVPVGVCAGPIENAHVVKGDGGTSYKASAEYVAPMCHHHHATLHRLGPISFQSVYKVDLAAEADACARAWRAHVGAAA